MGQHRGLIATAAALLAAFGGYYAWQSTSKEAPPAINMEMGSKIGVYNPMSAVWAVDVNGNGVWDGVGIDRTSKFGSPGDIPVVGDWNGNGHKKIGVFNTATATWLLDMNGNGIWDGLSVDKSVQWGSPQDVPVVGNWNGAGSQDKIGVFNPTTTAWVLDLNGNFTWDGEPGDRSIAWGTPGDIPVVGDWTGAGNLQKIGVFSPKTAAWTLDLAGDFHYERAKNTAITWGVPGNIPLIGDWSGSGTAKIGVYDSSKATFRLDVNGNLRWDSGVDKEVGWGSVGDRPVVGDWNSSGATKIGVFNPIQATWVLDINGNLLFEPGNDRTFRFGSPNDTPVVGHW